MLYSIQTLQLVYTVFRQEIVHLVKDMYQMHALHYSNCHSEQHVGQLVANDFLFTPNRMIWVLDDVTCNMFTVLHISTFDIFRI